MESHDGESQRTANGRYHHISTISMVYLASKSMQVVAITLSPGDTCSPNTTCSPHIPLFPSFQLKNLNTTNTRHFWNKAQNPILSSSWLAWYICRRLPFTSCDCSIGLPPSILETPAYHLKKIWISYLITLALIQYRIYKFSLQNWNLSIKILLRKD